MWDILSGYIISEKEEKRLGDFPKVFLLSEVTFSELLESKKNFREVTSNLLNSVLNQNQIGISILIFAHSNFSLKIP